jgi:hypothetical protein
VTVCQMPFGPVVAIDQGDSQRPVLGREPADLDILAFDYCERDHVGGSVSLDHFLFEAAVPEAASHRLHSLGSEFGGARVFATEGGRQREVVGVGDQRAVPLQVPAHQRPARLFGSLDEVGDSLIGVKSRRTVTPGTGTPKVRKGRAAASLGLFT